MVAHCCGVAGQVPARRQPSDPYSPIFTQSFLSCFPCVLSPVVVLRLLLHRLLTTAAHLQRWKSCASRSSFASASAHDAPRSPRSRASSTDTEPSSLRKRRKVSIDNCEMHYTARLLTPGALPYERDSNNICARQASEAFSMRFLFS